MCKTVFVALVAFAILLLAACADGGDGNGPSLTVVTSTSTPVGDVQDTPVSNDGTPVPDATSEPATATSTPDDEGAIFVDCGDIFAPLDKQHRLEEDCVPSDLVSIPAALDLVGGQTLKSDALAALEQMLSDAAAEGHTMLVLSAYRSYDRQVLAFNNNVAQYGEEEARRQSALPGHSEHQLGTTVDLTSAAVGHTLAQAFGATPEGLWVAEHSWEYGFIISYPEGKEPITGYLYEPWHIRYLGVDFAAAVNASGVTLHEYLLR